MNEDQPDDAKIMIGIMMYLRDIECEKPENIFHEDSLIDKDQQVRCIDKLQKLGLIEKFLEFLELTDSGRAFIMTALLKRDETVGVRTLMKTLSKSQYVYQNKRFKIITDSFLCSSAEKKFMGDPVGDFSGAFPAGFLKNVKTAFKEVYPTNPQEILHVCSGRISPDEGDRLDIDDRFKPDYVDNAETMESVPSNKYNWVMSDTPYNEKASQKYYGRSLLNRSKMVRAMNRVCKVGGFIGILDQISPNSTPKNLKRVALIFVTSIPNQDARIFTVFQKMKEEKK